MTGLSTSHYRRWFALSALVLMLGCGGADWQTQGFQMRHRHHMLQPHDGLWWSSWGNEGGDLVGWLTSPPFVLGSEIEIDFAGNPNKPGITVELEGGGRRWTLPLAAGYPFVWARARLSVPADLIGAQVRLRVEDRATGTDAWIAIGLPVVQSPAWRVALSTWDFVLVPFSFFAVILAILRLPQLRRPQAFKAVEVQAASRERTLRLACWVAALGLFLARGLSFFTSPRIWGEDGIVFLPQRFTDSAAGLLTAYSGYLCTLSRLWLLPGSLIPFDWIPLFLAAGGLAALAIAAAILITRTEPTAGVIMALAIVMAPQSHETVFNLVNSQWFSALWPAAIIATPPVGRRASIAVDALLLCLCALSGPFGVFWVPAFLLRAARDPAGKYYCVALAGGTSLQLSAYLLAKTETPRPIVELLVTLPSISKVAISRVLFVAHRVPGYVFYAVAVLAICVLFAMVMLTIRTKDTRLAALLLTLPVLVISAFLRRPASEFLADASLLWSDRYFVSPRAIWVWCLVLAYSNRSASRLLRVGAGGFVLLYFALSSLRFDLVEESNVKWSSYHSCAVTTGCSVPIEPTGWVYECKSGWHRW